jgi:hypothetical protein
MDPISYVLAMIEVAAADAAHSTIMSVNNSLFCNGILKFGTEAQKQLYVRAIAEGREIGAFALTEPQSGSDATAMRCKATKQADGSYVINGKKSWITSGPVAKYIVLFAMTDPEKHSRGITAFLIDTAKPGFLPRQDRAQARHPRVGHLRDRVPGLRRRAGRGARRGRAMASRSRWACSTAGRIGIASQALGIARAAYEATLAYVKERKAFGEPIGAFQMTQAKIADMKCKLDAATLLTLRAALAEGPLRAGRRQVRQRGGDRQAHRSEAAMWITAPGGADPRRHGLLEGDAAGALFPRREDHRDLRGHQRDPAPGDRPQRDRAALSQRPDAARRCREGTHPGHPRALSTPDPAVVLPRSPRSPAPACCTRSEAARRRARASRDLAYGSDPGAGARPVLAAGAWAARARSS